MKEKKKIKMPSSFAIIIGIIILVAILSWILPGGAYDYVDPTASKLHCRNIPYYAIKSAGTGSNYIGTC